MRHIFLMISTVGCLFIMTTATAQEEQKQEVQKHELSIYGLGGYSPLSYTLSNSGAKGGANSGGIGGGAGLGYTFNINPSLGIALGVEMATYASEASFGSVEGHYEEGADMQSIKFSYSLNNYREVQNLTLFSIPVMAQYSLPLGSGGSMRFYASGGFKLGFPINAVADITPGTATTSGYYAYEGVEYSNLKNHGFVDNEKLPDKKTDIDLGFSAALALETGIRFTLTDKIGLYTGVYFDYGLNNIQKVNNRHLLEYDDRNETAFRYYSVLNTDRVDKVNLLSIGLKLRVGFKL